MRRTLTALLVNFISLEIKIQVAHACLTDKTGLTEEYLRFMEYKNQNTILAENPLFQELD